MKKIAIAVSALAGIIFLSGCAYDTYGYYGDHVAYGYGVGYPYHHYYFRDGARFDCLYSYDVSFCG